MSIQTVGIIGAGTMGNGIAQACAVSGVNVVMVDISDAAVAKGYDFFTYYFTLFLTPMMFLSGVFFPRDQLPGIVRDISAWLPLTQAIALVRPLFMDQWPADAVLHLGVLALYALVGWKIALHLTKKRFKA